MAGGDVAKRFTGIVLKRDWENQGLVKTFLQRGVLEGYAARTEFINSLCVHAGVSVTAWNEKQIGMQSRLTLVCQAIVLLPCFDVWLRCFALVTLCKSVAVHSQLL